MSAHISWTETAGAPLVMLPGTLCDARLFAPVLELLGARAHIPPLSGASSAARMAEMLFGELPDRFALCGFSLGAIVALEMAAQAPQRIERLALIGCNPGILSPHAAAARRALRRAEFVATCYDRTDPFIRALIEDMAEAASPEVFAEQTGITLQRADSRPRLGDLTMPVLVLCGAEDEICPPSLSIEMAEAIPHARLAIIEDAGHYVLLEQPVPVANEISAWLATPTGTLH